MGFFARRRKASPEPRAARKGQASHRFSESAPMPIDEMWRQLYLTDDRVVTRTEALSVPAVTRGRNLICSIATLPLAEYDPDGQVTTTGSTAEMLAQFDPDVPNIVHLAQTLEDLLFESIAWWRVVGFGWDMYPTKVRRLDPCTVSLLPPNTAASRNPLPSGEDPRGATVWVDGKPVSASEIIRFDSPNPAVLHAGARSIRRALLLDRAAKMFAETPQASEYFTPAPNSPEADDDEIADILGKWKSARRTRSSGYVPAWLQMHTVDSPSPAQLQLVELQRQVGLEIANLMGVDPEELGISTTSRTYSNNVDRRKDKINDVLAPYMRAITDRLSMADVTRRGYTTRFDLIDYLKANPTERAAIQQTYFDMGVLDRDEIRSAEGLPPRPEPSLAPTPTDMPTGPSEAEGSQTEAIVDTVASADQPQYAFSAQGLTFVDIPLQSFTVDAERRIIEGLAVPYGKSAKGIRFERGSLQYADVTRVKLDMDHADDQLIGVASVIKDGPNGLFMRFKLDRTPEADRALMKAEDGVYDGLSVAVDFDVTRDTVADPRNRTGLLVKRADLRRVALTGQPAFDDARVTRVAASLNKEDTVDPTDATTETAPQPQTEPVAVPAQTFTAQQVGGLLEKLGKQLQEMQAEAALRLPGSPEGLLDPMMLREASDAHIGGGQRQQQFTRPTVNPTRPVAITRVTEPTSYRFDRSGALQPAAHDFGIDLVRAVHPMYGGGRADTVEFRRVMEFMRRQFDVDSADVNELNPTINLPKYVDEREFQYPLYSAVSRGAPPNGIQPFAWPKFSSASGLVAVHAEGVEPSSGTYVTTNQSVSPTGMSGKASVTRETWDMGGVPGLSDILWQRITRDWYETVEAAIVTMLNAASPTSLGTFTAGGGTDKQTLVAEMRANLAALQFVRGGFRFDLAAAQADLYAALVAAVDDGGRPIFPAVGPQNVDGTASGRWALLDVNGVPFYPAWALAAAGQTTTQSSYLLDRTAVDCWTSGPQRLIFDETEVRYVHVGVWGYRAEAINDINGVREILYDPTA